MGGRPHASSRSTTRRRFCGCGGRGHIEGIMGHRAMRLRFLDMEPEEVFAEARNGDNPGRVACRASSVSGTRRWRPAPPTEIHMSGAGKFFLTGFNARFVDLPMLKDYLHQMIKMSPLQGYTLEIVEDRRETRILGAAVAAEQASGNAPALR